MKFPTSAHIGELIKKYLCGIILNDFGGNPRTIDLCKEYQ